MGACNSLIITASCWFLFPYFKDKLVLEYELLREGSKKSPLKCGCGLNAKMSLTEGNPDFWSTIHHWLKQFYVSWLDFEIVSVTHPHKDGFLFKRSYTDKTDHVPNWAALDPFLAFVSCSADNKESIKVWGHEETPLWCSEAASVSQPCFHVPSVIDQPLLQGFCCCILAF